MKTYWIFLAYKTEQNYPLKPFHKKIFNDFDKMKTHSAKHSKQHKHNRCHPGYISIYIKTKL